MKRREFYQHKWMREDTACTGLETMEFPDAGANVPDGALNQRGQKHSLFIISLFEGSKHHVIFHSS